MAQVTAEADCESLSGDVNVDPNVVTMSSKKLKMAAREQLPGTSQPKTKVSEPKMKRIPKRKRIPDEPESFEVVGFSDEQEGLESDVNSEAEFSVFEAGQACDMSAIGGGSPTGQTVESDESQSQSESGEASESGSDSDENEGNVFPPNKRPRVNQDSTQPQNASTFSIFDPIKVAKGVEWQLPAEREAAITQHFYEIMPDDVIKETILKDAPVPVSNKLHPLDLDSDMLDLLPKAAVKPTKSTDYGYRRMQRKVFEVMGPLSKVWCMVEDIAKEGNKVVDIDEIRTLIQQSIILLGQVNASGNYSRRFNIMSRFLRDQKRARNLLLSNSQLLNSNDKDLFGQKFYKALRKVAKGNKHKKEIVAELGGASSQKRKPFRKGALAFQPTRGGQQHQYGQYHYQNQPQAQDKQSKAGRGRSQTSRGQGRQNQTKRYVCFTSSSFIKCKHRHRDNQNKCGVSGKGRGKSCRTNIAFLKKCPCGTDCSRLGALRAKTRLACWREVKTLQGKLGKAHSRPSHSRSRVRLSSSICGTASTADNSSQTKIFHCGGEKHNEGDPKNASEKCYRESASRKRSISKSHFSSTKKGWHKQACVQLEKPKQVCAIRTLQDGEHAHANSDNQARRLDGKNRSKRCIFLYSNCQTSPAISPVPVAGPTNAVQGHAIWAGMRSPSIHKNHETSGFDSTTIGHTSLNLSGRPHCVKPTSKRVAEGCELSSVASSVFRVCDKLGEINTTPNTEHRIPGVHGKFPGINIVPPRSETEGHKTGVCVSAVRNTHNSSSVSTGNREIDCDSISSLASTVAFSMSSNSEDESTVKRQTVIRSNNRAITGLQKRTPLVDTTDGGEQWQGYDSAIPRPSNHNRCFEKRVGGGVQYSDSTGPMESRRVKVSHKCAGIDSRGFCGKSLHKKSDKGSCSPKIRQCDDGFSDKQNGRNQIHGPVAGHKISVGVLSIEQDHNYSRTSPGSDESDCRQGKSGFQRFQQLETARTNVPSNAKSVGTDRDRSFCRSAKCSGSSLRQLETRSGRSSNRRILNNMEGAQSLCLSTNLHDRSVSHKNPEGEGTDYHCDTSLASSAMVPIAYGNECDATSIVSTTPSHPGISSRGTTPTGEGRSHDISGMEGLRRRMSLQGLSEQATSLLMGARRAGTQATYKGPWKEWTRWCVQRKIDPFQATLGDIANFLAESFDRGIEYSTLNVYRSAISAYHPRIEGHKVGQHPVIVELLKGAFNQRPSKPRYTDTWEVAKVLKCILDMGGNSVLSLKDLTLKVAMLMALTSACRGSELHQLDPTKLQRLQGKIRFTIDGLTKTRKTGQPPKQVQFTSYSKESKLDVVAALELYLDKTKRFRTNKNSQHQLFLTFIKPHKAVARCTIARWLKMLMTRAGIDVSKYKAHSTRAAASSKAKVLGMSAEQIIDRADWSNVNTFYKFYHKDILETDSFQNLILSLH